MFLKICCWVSFRLLRPLLLPRSPPHSLHRSHFSWSGIFSFQGLWLSLGCSQSLSSFQGLAQFWGTVHFTMFVCPSLWSLFSGCSFSLPVVPEEISIIWRRDFVSRSNASSTVCLFSLFSLTCSFSTFPIRCC